jgi:uncharacterized repeat protein (TIGR01451 family)
MRSSLRILGVTMSLSLLLLGSPSSFAKSDFAAARSYPVGTSPAGIAVGDFNGDGKADIAVANTGSSNVSILLGNGDGTFQPAVNFSAGNSPSAIAVGDFNGDGKLDLAAFQPGANGVAGSVSVLLGNGDGTFQAPKTLALSQNASLMAVADLNLDKKSDLAVIDPTSLDIFIGNGDGTFQPAKQTGLSSNCAGFIAADFNGDSKPDVALVTTAGIHILLGKGDGTFSQGTTVTVTSVSSPNSVAYESVVAADLNHDGKMDLLVDFSHLTSGRCFPFACTTTYTNISAFLGNGDGSFQGEQVVASETLRMNCCGIPPRGYKIDHPFVGDFNGDGKLDLAYRLTPGVRTLTPFLEFLLGKGDGTFTLPVLHLAGSVVAKQQLAQDLNADGLTDLIGLGTANDVDVVLNTSPTSGADLGLLFSGASPDPVGVGTNLTFTAHVFNQGPHDATGVTFTDTLPNNVNFDSATATLGSCVQSHGMVSCNIGSLASAFESEVTIVATPTVAGAITNSMSVTANEPDPVTANNTATQTADVVPVFTLTVTKTGNGSGTVTSNPGINGAINCGSVCLATYLSSAGVTLTASADANSLFAGWSGICTGTAACGVTMNADQAVTANFALGVKLSVALSGGGSGSVTSTDNAISCGNSGGNCSSLYLPGTSVSLTATPAGSAVFGGWSGACTGTDPNVCSVTMNSVQSVTASFNPPVDFTLAPAVTTFTTQTGAQVTDALTLTEQNGFSGQLNLTCTVNGPAPLATCGITPSSVTLGSSPGNSTLTITAPTSLAAFALPLNEGSRNTESAVVLPFPALLLGGIGLASRNFRKRPRSLWLLGGSVMILLAVLAGCGGGTAPPPPQHYTITVTAATPSGSLKHSTTVMLTVQ